MVMPEPVDIPKNDNDVLRIEASEFKGHHLASIRVWFRDEQGELRPSKVGVSFKRTLLPRIIEALTAIDRADGGAAADYLGSAPADETVPTGDILDVDESEIPF